MRMSRPFLAVALFCAGAALAQTVPTRVSFTGRMVDNGAPVQGNRDFVFKLYPTLMMGTAIWTETRNSVPVVDGSVNVDLGASTPLTDAIFDGQTLYLEVTVGTTVLSPRTPVVSVPYALRSGVSGQVGSLTPAQIQQRVTNGCGVGSAIQTINADGTVVCQAAGAANDAGVSTITNITAGAGLTGGGAIGNVTLAVAYGGSGGGNGSASTAARSDHVHTGVYLPLGPTLACMGTDKVVGLNSSGSVVCAPAVAPPYSALANGGLSLSGNQFSLGLCAAGQVLKSTGAGWTCLADANSGGTVTSITAGPGLTGGAISTSGTIGLAPTVQNWAGQPGCPGGQYMRTIAVDGTPTCVPDGNSGGTVTSVGAGAGLTGGPITGAGVLAVNFGSAPGTVTQGNDPRLLPPPSGAGRMLYDNGAAWVQLGTGTANNVLVGGPAPSWSSATGITSVGTLTSVNVSGTATVGSLAFAAAKTSYVTVHASAFHPIRSTEGYSTGGHCCGNDRSYVAAVGNNSGLAAPVSFPNGATPTTLTCRVLDSSAAFNVSVRLVEAVGSSAYCSSTSTGTSAAYQNLAAGCSLGPVDNSASAWWLSFQADGTCGPSCAIVSCTVTYTMTGLP